MYAYCAQTLISCVCCLTYMQGRQWLSHTHYHNTFSNIDCTRVCRSHFCICVALVWLVNTAAGVYVDAKPKLHFGTTLCAHRVLRNECYNAQKALRTHN